MQHSFHQGQSRVCKFEIPLYEHSPNDCRVVFRGNPDTNIIYHRDIICFEGTEIKKKYIQNSSNNFV